MLVKLPLRMAWRAMMPTKISTMLSQVLGTQSAAISTTLAHRAIPGRHSRSTCDRFQPPTITLTQPRRLRHIRNDLRRAGAGALSIQDQPLTCCFRTGAGCEIRCVRCLRRFRWHARLAHRLKPQLGL